MSNLENLMDNPPANCEKTAELYSWSTNYDIRLGTPFGQFLDLIGYSDEQYGEKIIGSKFILDNEGAYALGEALIEWSNRPHEVEAYCYAILESFVTEN